MVSNYVGNDLPSQARDWSKKEGRFVDIERPTMVVEYNSHMRGVDLYNMLLSLYRIHHQSTKYSMHIVFYCIGVALVNGWLLYRWHMVQKNLPARNQLSLLKFQAELAASLCKLGKLCGEAVRWRGRPSSTSPVPAATPSRERKAASIPNPTKDIQLDSVKHFPQFQDKQQHCCHYKNGHSHIKCTKYRVHLCLVKARNCFTVFHAVQ